MGRADTFDAGEFGVLRYDFKKFGGVQGVINDPSDEMIEAFLTRMRELAKQYGGDEKTPEELDAMGSDDLADYLDGQDKVNIVAIQKEMAGATSALCGGTPSAEDLLALPLRVRQRFQRWLSERLLNPESEASDGGVSPLRRIGG
jgi:hypothetical protein